MPTPQEPGEDQNYGIIKFPDINWQGVGDGIGAGVRAGVDAITLGIPDKLQAAQDATAAALGGGDWMSQYQATRNQQLAQDQYDATHHPIAQRVGQGLGTAASLLATDGLTAPAGAARVGFTASKLAEGSALRAFRPWGAAAGTGALASVAGQGFTDAMTGHLSDLPTYASDVVGGAAGGVAALARSPSAAAAASAAASGVTHSALTGTALNFNQMSRDAVAGAGFGLLGHVSGTQWAKDLDWKKGKGPLGDKLAEWASNIYDNKITARQRGVNLPGGGRTIADFRSEAGPIEAKFGESAELSMRQKQAKRELPNYIILHFLPTDIGHITGGLLSIAGSHPSTDGKPWMTQTSDDF